MTEKHYNMVQEELNNATEEQKEKYLNKSGIYGIYCDGNLVYVGKSTNLLNRFVAHKCNTLCDESPEYNSTKYRKLREAIQLGHNISIQVLEFAEVGQNLSQLEDKWIGSTLPALNTIIPNSRGGHCRKQVSNII